MIDVMEHLGFLLGHWQGAIGAAIAFLIGSIAARYVVAHNIRFLMAGPLWLLKRIAKFLEKRPPVVAIAGLIFAFNGTAIFVYMLFGLIPYMPAVIAFLTGMNVAVAALNSGEIMKHGGMAPRGSEGGVDDPSGKGGAVQPNPRALLCSGIVFAIELPCFWFSIAMGAGMDYWFGTVWQPENAADFRMRVLTYLVIVLPLLALSALAEGYAVKYPVRPAHEGDE